MYEDTGHGEPQSSIGPVVGPFDQALQARLLQDLEPAVQQVGYRDRLQRLAIMVLYHVDAQRQICGC